MSELVTLEQHGQVSVLTLDNGENRWTTTLVREVEKVLDEVEASEGPHALVTASSDQKFFSNGLDLDWITTKGEHPGGDRRPTGPTPHALEIRSGMLVSNGPQSGLKIASRMGSKITLKYTKILRT